MAKVEHYYTRFQEREFYHIYNRTVDRKPMFITDENCSFFLKRLRHFLNETIDIYTYNLLDNHFHLLIKVKDLTDYRAKYKIKDSVESHLIVSKTV